MRILPALLGLLVLLAPAGARADRDSALAALRQQSLILESRIDDRGVLWAIVKPDKLAWDQFATFLCQQMAPHQARIFTVRVVDVTSIGRGRKQTEWKILAQAQCG
jgi:hypothetical protein